jgi:type III secretion system low calcium response chaperone LcrH/SycD
MATTQDTTEAQPGDALLRADPDHLAALARQIMDGNTDLAAIAGMTEQEIEAVYSLGHGFYGSGAYQDAIDIFRFLCMHRHMDARFWFGLGASSQMVADYQTAVAAYRTCAMLDLSNAQVPLRAAECFRALGETENMRQALEAVVVVAERYPVHAAYGRRASMMLEQMGAAS